MAIPGLKAELPLRAKVRVGDRADNGAPRSLDHFVCDDPSFTALTGAEKPSTLLVRFPYATAEDVFPTGFEWWMKAKAGKPILACYTKGDGKAHRITKGEVDEHGQPKFNPTPGSERRPMVCPGRDCPRFGKERDQGCRPQARLNFFLVGDSRVDAVFRFETKAWNTIEQVAAVLDQYPDLRGHVFELYAERRQQGTKKFTVVGVREHVPPLAAPDVGELRRAIATELKRLGQYPPADNVKAWIAEKGYEAALAALAKRKAAA